MYATKQVASILVFLLLAAEAASADWVQPDPILVQIKESLRTSLDLDAQLQALAATEASLGMTLVRTFAGTKYIQMLSYPSGLTREQQGYIITQLQQAPQVEQMASVLAANLVFRAMDLARSFEPNEVIPDVIRRGLESPPFVLNPAVVLSSHYPNYLIVGWKPEFLWNAAQTGFLAKIAAFNAAAGCRVVSETSYSATDLSQVLVFSGSDNLLLSKLQRYANSGLVRFAEPDAIYSPTIVPVAPPTARPRPVQTRRSLSRPVPMLEN
jgi:hypothetical protein